MKYVSVNLNLNVIPLEKTRIAEQILVVLFVDRFDFRPATGDEFKKRMLWNKNIE